MSPFPPPPPAEWGPYVAERLRALEAGEGDFAGLQRPTKRTIARARLFADAWFDRGTCTPSVVPSEDGAVAFVWLRAGWHLEAEVGPSRTEVWGRVTSERRTVFAGSFDLHESAFLKTLRALSAYQPERNREEA